MEEYGFCFQIEPLSLEEYGIIAAASQICNHHFPKIREKVIHNENVNTSHVANLFSAQLIKKEISINVHHKLSCLQIPKVTKEKLRRKVLELISELYDWITFVVNNLELNSKYLNRIYWTSAGDIDVDKIIKLSWINIPVDDVASSEGLFSEIFSPMHYLACFLAQDHLVRNFQNDIISEIKYIFPWFKIDKKPDIVFRIISIVIFCYNAYAKNRNFSTIRKDEITKENLSPVKMLGICRYWGLQKAFIYFYTHLDGVEEENYLNSVSKSNFAPECNFKDFNWNDYFYRKGNKFPMAILLLKKMNDSQKNNFILRNFCLIFLHSMSKESFQQFCVPIVDKFLIQAFNENSSGDIFTQYERFLCICITFIKNEVTDLQLDCRFHQRLFELLMKKIPERVKIQVLGLGPALTSTSSSSLLSYAYSMFCIPALKSIVNDPDLQTYKNDLINKGKDKFKSLIEYGRYKDLTEFKSQVLCSETERNEFYKIFQDNFFASWIANSKFQYLQNYLTFRYGKEACSYKTDLYPIWCSFVPKDYTNIKCFLEWFFNKNKMPSMINCKNDTEILYLKRLCRELIYNVWFRSKVTFFTSHITPAIYLSNQILSSVFVSENEITNFKRNELVRDESCVTFLCTNTLNKPNNRARKGECRFEPIDEFFNFCELSKNKIAKIKKSIIDNENDWIVKYGVNVNRFDIAVPLLEWLHGKKANNNRKILKKYFRNHEAIDAYYRQR